MELTRYIHLNPVRAKIVAEPIEYHWSSYGGYIGKQKTPPWLNVGFILGLLGKQKNVARKKYVQFVEGAGEESLNNPLSSVVAQTILGSEQFLENIQEKHLSDLKQDRNRPALGQLSRGKSISEIEEVALRFLTCEAQKIRNEKINATSAIDIVA